MDRSRWEGPLNKELSEIIEGRQRDVQRSGESGPDEVEQDWQSRLLHLAGAAMGAGEAEWSRLDWNGFVGAMADNEVSWNILGEGEALVWAFRAGLLEPSFSNTSERWTYFERLSLHLPKVAMGVVVDPRHWGSWLLPGVERLGLDRDPGRWSAPWAAVMAAIPAEGFEAPTLINGKANPRLGGASGLLHKAGASAALDQAEAAGMLRFFKQTGRLEAWATLCLTNANEERLLRAISAGADLSLLTPDQAWCAFVRTAISAGPGQIQWAATYGQGKKKELAAVRAFDEGLKQRVWVAAARAGMPKVECDNGGRKKTGRSHAPHSLCSAGSMARAEIERGGLRGSVAMEWLVAGVLKGGMESKGFGGVHPLAWSLSHGLCASDLSRGALWVCLLEAANGSSVDGLLAALAVAGAKLDGSEVSVDIFEQGRESLMGRLLHLGASAKGVADAVAVGIDGLAASKDGEPIAKQLFGLDRAGGEFDRFSALLMAVGKGGAQEILAQRAPDGSGPMHWAARGLCPSSVTMLAARGLDPNERDAEGLTPGHWVARRYSASKSAKIMATMDALTKAGMDWKAENTQGSSVLAALCKKAPLDVVERLLEANPTAFDTKGSNGASPMDNLAKRGTSEPRAGVIVERSALSSVAAAASDQSKGKSRRI